MIRDNDTNFDLENSHLPKTAAIYMVATQRILEEHDKWIENGIDASYLGINEENKFKLEPGNCGEVCFKGAFEEKSAVRMNLPSLPLGSEKKVTLNSMYFYAEPNDIGIDYKKSIYTVIEISVFSDSYSEIDPKSNEDWFRIYLSPETAPRIEIIETDTGPILEYMTQEDKEYQKELSLRRKKLNSKEDIEKWLIDSIFAPRISNWPGSALLTDDECGQLIGLIENCKDSTAPNILY